MKIYHLVRYKIAINKCLSIPLVSTFHEQHWNVKLNSVCSNLALQMRFFWGSWTLCCHRHLPQCVLGERDTKPQDFPAGWCPGRGSDAIPQQQPWQKNWMLCGEKANEDNHSGCAEHLRVLGHTTKPFSPRKKTTNPAAFMILCQATSFT